MSVLFASIPNLTFTPLVPGSSFVTVVCWSAAEPLDAMTRNLFVPESSSLALSGLVLLLMALRLRLRC